MPDGATKTDGRSCSGPFQRSRLLARPAFLNDVITSFRMLKAPTLVFVFTLGHKCISSHFWLHQSHVLQWFCLALAPTSSSGFLRLT